MPSAYRNIQFNLCDERFWSYNLFLPEQRFFLLFQDSCHSFNKYFFGRLFFFFIKDDLCYVPPLPHVSFTGEVCVDSNTVGLAKRSLEQLTKQVLDNFYSSYFEITHTSRDLYRKYWLKDQKLEKLWLTPQDQERIASLETIRNRCGHDCFYDIFLESWKSSSQKMLKKQVDQDFPCVKITRHDDPYIADLYPEVVWFSNFSE